MGIKVSDGGGRAVFYRVNAKEGCLEVRENGHTSKFEPGRAAIEGTLIKFVIDKGEYEGTPNETLRLVLRDSEVGAPNMHVSFKLTNAEEPVFFTMRALGLLNAADFNQPIEIKPYLFEAGSPTLSGGTYDKDTSGVAIKQGGVSLKPDFMTEDNKLPDSPPVMAGGKEVKVNGRVVRDTSAMKAHIDVLLDAIANRLPAMNQGEAQAPADDSVGVEDAAAAAAHAVSAAPAREAMRARG